MKTITKSPRSVVRPKNLVCASCDDNKDPINSNLSSLSGISQIEQIADSEQNTEPSPLLKTWIY